MSKLNLRQTSCNANHLTPHASWFPKKLAIFHGLQIRIGMPHFQALASQLRAKKCLGPPLSALSHPFCGWEETPKLKWTEQNWVPTSSKLSTGPSVRPRPWVSGAKL